MKIIKRYSDFDDLRQKLVKTFPHSVASMPPLPPKSVVCKSHPLAGPLFALHPS